MLLWTVNSVDKRLAASKVTSTERHWLSLAVVFLFLAEQPEWNSPSALCGCLNLCLLRTHKHIRHNDTFTLKVNGYVCYDIPGKVTSVKRQTPNNHPSLFCLSSCLFNFPQRMVFFLKTLESASKRAPCWHPRTQHPAPDLVVHCSCQSASRDTQPRVFMTKGQIQGSPLSVHSKEPVRRKQEVLETETGVSLWLASFIRRAHGCLLINTPGTGASDPETSRVSVGSSPPPRSVCGTKRPLRQPTATTGSHQLQYV